MDADHVHCFGLIINLCKIMQDSKHSMTPATNVSFRDKLRLKSKSI